MTAGLPVTLAAAWRRLARRSMGDIGLQMSLEAMQLVQFSAQPCDLALHAAVSLDYGCGLDEILANERKFAQLVRRALASDAFRGRRVITCMPSAQVKTLIVSYAVEADGGDGEAIARALDARLDGNADDVVFDYLPVRQEGRDSSHREALVAFASKTCVTAYLEHLSAAGLHVVAIDIGPNALARIVRLAASAGEGRYDNVLLINFGSETSFVTLFWGRRLMLDRPIAFAEHRLLERVTTAMRMPQAMAKRLLVECGFSQAPERAGCGGMALALREILHPEFMALKAEVSRTLIYTASKTRGKTVDRIYLVGSVARYPGVAELVAEELGMPAEVLDPFSMFRWDGRHIAAAHPGAAVAAGLALRGVRA